MRVQRPDIYAKYREYSRSFEVLSAEVSSTVSADEHEILKKDVILTFLGALKTVDK